MRSRAIAAAEVLAVFVACQLYLWLYYARYRRGWLLILAFIAISMIVRRETAERLGLTLAGSRGATRWMTVGVVASAGPLLLYGWWRCRIALAIPDAEVLGQFALYFAWCFLQQFAMQSYVHNRLRDALPGSRRVPLIVGVIFAAMHLPNPVLTIATLVGGVLTAEVFSRYRTLWPVALGQALISAAIVVSLPDAWHHRLRVGPGYFWWGVRR